jgi:hypothetical protein
MAPRAAGAKGPAVDSRIVGGVIGATAYSAGAGGGAGARRRWICPASRRSTT